jgi:hypothetical protein
MQMDADVTSAPGMSRLKNRGVEAAVEVLVRLVSGAAEPEVTTRVSQLSWFHCNSFLQVCFQETPLPYVAWAVCMAGGSHRRMEWLENAELPGTCFGPVGPQRQRRSGLLSETRVPVHSG